MHRYIRSTILISLAVVLFSACNRMPDHARYIPKDAIAVAGINLKGLGKKIAWNMITGSKLFKEMQQHIPEKNGKDAVSGIEKAGIDAMNTFYVYVKTDTRFKGGNRITGLVPLSDANQWETYVKLTFPQVDIKQHGDRKEAGLGSNMYVGWSKNLLIIINVMPATPDYFNAGTGGSEQHEKSALDMAAISAEMDNAFHVTKENSIVGNKRFSELETEGHDLTFWLNYEQLMSQYMSGNIAEKMGVSLSNTLWKDAGFAAGFDFIKGKITGDMRYYLSSEMKDIGTEFGATNADKDMIDRLPNQNMDLLMAIHLSPKGTKDILEKMGILGLVNIGLGAEGLNADNVLDAFTGDMAIVMNDFSLHTENVRDSFMGQVVMHQNQKPSLSMNYVIKINKKEEFQKLKKLAKETGLPAMGSGFVYPIDDKDSVYILMNDQYLVVSNKYANATGFLQGDFKSQKMPEAVVAQVPGHPVALYVDIQQLFKNIDAGISHSSHDSAMIVESKKLLNNMSLTGGIFKDNAFEYHLDINFTNTDENSIIQLMDYGMKMSDTDKITRE
ncbi:MAG: DUF4836 family protein [Chitinophagales bacterium]